MENTVKAVAVTGATSGIGLAVCKALLSAGYSVIGVGRNAKACADTEATLQSKFKDSFVRFICRDLMRRSDVISAAGEIASIAEKQFNGRLYALINNAGCVRSRYMTTTEGFEQQFALNYLAGFILTHELLGIIRKSDTRVIFTSSASHKMMRVNWNDLMYQRRYRPLCAYKQSKLCNMLLAHRLRAMGVRSCGVDPGLVRTEIGNKNTDGLVSFVWKLRKRRGDPPEKAARTYLFLCENDFDELYYGDSGVKRRVSREVNSKNADRLYTLCLKLCGLEDEVPPELATPPIQ